MIDSEKLRGVMLEKCFTQGGLAKEAGISRETVDNILKGKARKRPNIQTVGRLCRALGVNAAEILKEGVSNDT